MRKPYAKAMCTRVLLKDVYRGFLNGGAAAGGRRPPVEEERPEAAPPCRHILEEDPGAQGFRIGLAHRAGAYTEAAILSSVFWQATNQPINQPPQTVWWVGWGWGWVGWGSV